MSFLNNLSLKDRNRLRFIVKNIHLKHYPLDKINNYEADKLIESFGERTIYELIKQGVDSGNVN